MRSKRKLRRNIGLLLLAGAGTLVLADFGRELIAVDRCLDAGHVYDYHEGRCREDVTHRPDVPYAERRAGLLCRGGCPGDTRSRAHRARLAKQVTSSQQTVATVPKGKQAWLPLVFEQKLPSA
jgi:hypothetical protein